MVEFNPDGSIKLPSRMTKQNDANDNLFATQPSFKILRNQTSTVTPLTCELHIEASKHILTPNIIELAFNEAKNNFKTDAGLTKTNNVIKIVSGFNRCNWCHHFIDHLADRSNARIIRTDRCDDKTRNNHL
ncbi:MAG: hypothetical protein AABW88_00060 [Nanoarchaeota archaeon]